MSIENIREIIIEEDKVFLTTVASNVKSQLYATGEFEPFSKVLVEEGREALLARIGQEMWNYNLHLQKGNELYTFRKKKKEAATSSRSLLVNRRCKLFLSQWDHRKRFPKWSQHL